MAIQKLLQVTGINLRQASPLDLDYTVATTEQLPDLKVTHQFVYWTDSDFEPNIFSIHIV
jgi:hypothetical protein